MKCAVPSSPCPPPDLPNEQCWPCTPQQLKSMADMGKLVSSSVEKIALDAGLPSFASKMGAQALANVAGGIQGAVGKAIGEWKALEDSRLELAYEIGSQVLFQMFSNQGDAGEQVAALSQAMINSGLKLLVEVGGDVANIVPVVGAVVNIVFDLIAVLAEMLKRPNTYAIAIQTEQDRHKACVETLRMYSEIRPSGPNGESLPCDIFNGGGFYDMPAIGFGLMAATEANSLVPVAVRERIGNLRRAVQGSYNGQPPRGRDVATGKIVPATGPITDGGASLWPIYMDQVLWQSAIGNLADDVVFQSIAPYTNCALELVAPVRAFIDNWKLRKTNADTGAGYLQFAPQMTDAQKTAFSKPVTTKQLIGMEVGAAYYAGLHTGVQYKIAGNDTSIALVGPESKAISFTGKLALRRVPARKAPPTVLVFGLALGAAWGCYKLADRYLLR